MISLFKIKQIKTLRNAVYQIILNFMFYPSVLLYHFILFVAFSGFHSR